MIEIGSIRSGIVQWVGNKANGDGVVFSPNKTSLDEIEGSIKMLINDSFHFERLYHFSSIESLDLNPLFRFCSNVFEDNNSIVEQSHNIARHLYEQSLHPNTKGGELYVIYYADCKFEDYLCDAIAILKTESKDVYLKSQNTGEGISVKEEHGTNLKKLDKGCLILNMEKDKGYIVASVDNTNNGNDAHYWTDKFLNIKQRNDEYYQTEAFSQLFKSFLKGMALDHSISNADKALLARRCSDYLLSEESFTIESVADNVIRNKELKTKFNNYSDYYQEKKGIDLKGDLKVSLESANRNKGGSIGIVKLDNNFEVKFLGGEKYVIRGYDERRSMYYYQLFFNEEK